MFSVKDQFVNETLFIKSNTPHPVKLRKLIASIYASNINKEACTQIIKLVKYMRGDEMPRVGGKWVLVGQINI